MNPPKNRSKRSSRRGAILGGALLAILAGGLSCAPHPPANPPLKVVFYTDIHSRTEWDTPEAMARAAAAITAEKADLVICGGDMIADGYTSSPEQAAPRWEVYQAMHDAIRPTPVVVLGNHDLVGVEPADGSAPVADPRAEIRARFGLAQTYRSFDFRGVHFILLDTVEITDDPWKYRGYVGPEQMRWLAADLAGVAPETPIVVASHFPLLTGFYQMTEGIEAAVPPNRGVVNNREVLAAFANHRLLAVLQGHLHANETLRWGATTFITGGAVCGMWWRGVWHGTPEGYGVLLVHPDRVEWEYRTYGWEARRPAGM